MIARIAQINAGSKIALVNANLSWLTKVTRELAKILLLFGRLKREHKINMSRGFAIVVAL